MIDKHYRVNMILDNLPVTVYDLLDDVRRLAGRERGRGRMDGTGGLVTAQLHGGDAEGVAKGPAAGLPSCLRGRASDSRNP